jgi:hypothetical protein
MDVAPWLSIQNASKRILCRWTREESYGGVSVGLLRAVLAA